uniref:Zinc finger protein 585B n=2 Tax=Culex pipiens TaxID=7175 RepID=A0A8D8ACR6_CULPI
MVICRVCIRSSTKGDSLVPIFSKLEDEFIANLIVECSGVQIFEDDGLPTQICSTCLSDLRQTKNFVRKVRASDRKLRRSQRSELCEVEKLDSGDHVDDDDSPWQMIQVHVEEMKLEKEDETESNSGATRARKSRRMVKRTRFAPSDSEEDESVDELHKLFKKKVTCKDDDDDAPMELSTVKRQMMRRQKRRVVDDSQSTESETDSEPVIRRRRKPRARKRENSLAKHDYSEDEHIPSETLQEMYRTVSVDPDTHVCCACLRIFSDRAELVEHGKVAHNKKKYVNEAKTNICDVCFRRYSKASALQTHKQSFVGLNGVYECCRCMTRVTAQNRRQHARIHLKHRDELTDHEKPRRAQICCAKDCLASFPTEDLLLAHGKEQHIDNRIESDDLERRYECPVCFKRFEKRDGLTRHRHRMYRATHQCSVCGKEFKTRYEVLLHERNHDNIKPYPCEICGKKFNSREAVRIHMLVHSDDKPFACISCGWRFRRKCNLNKHMMKHKEDTPYSCSICQKTFKGKYHLQYHMRIHTGHKPWQCRYCEKSFADHANRARHETSHTGDIFHCHCHIPDIKFCYF